MSLPAVSILLPVFNCDKYLPKAVDSLLGQTFTDFELLIINDGSTDGTEEIIQSYSDNRIMYIKNQSNKGLIYTLNKGIELAKGKYIARMDADDICLAERLYKQFEWLEKHTLTAAAGCFISFINQDGLITGTWKDDLETQTHQSIKKKMAWQNCIAHPAVMVRTAVLKNYKYQYNQKDIEDYDLWLRMLADEIIIEKVPEKLLLYRIHETSITGSILRKTNPFLKQYNCKKRFLFNQVKNGKWGWFETKVLFTTIHNGLMGIGKNIKGIIKG